MLILTYDDRAPRSLHNLYLLAVNVYKCVSVNVYKCKCIYYVNVYKCKCIYF